MSKSLEARLPMLKQAKAKVYGNQVFEPSRNRKLGAPPIAHILTEEADRTAQNKRLIAQTLIKEEEELQRLAEETLGRQAKPTAGRFADEDICD